MPTEMGNLWVKSVNILIIFMWACSSQPQREKVSANLNNIGFQEVYLGMTKDQVENNFGRLEDVTDEYDSDKTYSVRGVQQIFDTTYTIYHFFVFDYQSFLMDYSFAIETSLDTYFNIVKEYNLRAPVELESQHPKHSYYLKDTTKEWNLVFTYVSYPTTRIYLLGVGSIGTNFTEFYFYKKDWVKSRYKLFNE